MKFKEKLANDSVTKLLFPNKNTAKVAWLEGFKVAKILILNELYKQNPNHKLIDLLSDLGEENV